MTAMLLISLTILLICSFLGYMLLAKRAIGMSREFIPVFVFSSVACIIFFCGLAGILFAGSVVVMGIGLIAFCVFLAERLRNRPEFKFRPTLFGFFWIALNLFFFSLLLKSELTHYDNFSHWAIVVKQMLSTDAFPTASSRLIDFKNYPLGISSFIYYICRFVGNYRQIMILAQGLLIFSCFYAIFGIIAEKKDFCFMPFWAWAVLRFHFSTLQSESIIYWLIFCFRFIHWQFLLWHIGTVQTISELLPLLCPLRHC